MDTVALVRIEGRKKRGNVNRGAAAPAARESFRSRGNGDDSLPTSAFLLADSAAKVITDETGRVLWASPGADFVTSEDSCISMEHGELSGRTRHSDFVLRRVLSAIQAVDHPVEQLLARTVEEGPELFVRAQARYTKDARLNTFTFRRLDRDVREIPDLRKLYGLTRTEQQVVREMIQGKSVSEIAAKLHKSILTVRTHVKRIYTKLHVGSKEQLFSRVLRLMVD